MSDNLVYIPILLEDFDYLYYLKQNPDLKQAHLKTLVQCFTHWCNHGCYENRKIRSNKTGEEMQILVDRSKKMVHKQKVIEKGNNINEIRVDFKNFLSRKDIIKSQIPNQIELHRQKQRLLVNRSLNSLITLTNPIAVLVHIFDINYIQFFIKNLNHLNTRYTHDSIRIYINIVLENNPYFVDDNNPTEEKISDFKTLVNSMFSQSLHNKNVKIYYNENKGGDIGGLLLLIKEMFLSGEDYSHFIFVHSKTKYKWRYDLCSIIFNYPLENLSHGNSIGLISSQKWIRTIQTTNKDYQFFESHLLKLYKILKFNDYYQNTLQKKYKDIQSWKFVAGTMFIANINIAKYIFENGITDIYSVLNKLDTIDENWVKLVRNLNRDPRDCGNDLQYRVKYGKPLYADHMIEHAVERIIGLICEKLKLKIIGE